MKYIAQRTGPALALLAAGMAFLGSPPASGEILDEKIVQQIAEAEAERLAAIERVRPAVVAVFAQGGRGGGSGVIIDPEGYALTNFHVVQPTGPTQQCGLADGVLYDAVVVGIDQVGDVALIKLIPKEPGKPFPYAPMGDSDKVKVGDWSIAMGNPFLLATDFTPTVTYGLVSGVNRYQYPAGTKLEYTDCIQIDTSINPGNSGGPLFNTKGEIIGINGRGSFEKRGRVNSGVGYAISINQIKNFLGHLRAGLDADHATLGAEVYTSPKDDKTMMIGAVLESSDAYRRGIATDDILLSFAGRSIHTANEYKNVLGIYPREWRVPVRYKHWDDEKKEYERPVEKLVRLMGVIRKEVKEEPKPGAPPQPQPQPGRPPAGPQGPAAKFYEAAPGFANYYFNRLERKRLYDAFQKQADFRKETGEWTITGSAELTGGRNDDERIKKYDAITFTISDEACSLRLGPSPFEVDLVKGGKTERDLREPGLPTNSGGLLIAMNQWRRFLVQGEAGFILKNEKDYLGKFIHGGYEPFYPKATPQPLEMAEVIITEYSHVRCKFYFSMNREKPLLIGMECYPVREPGDPCELVFSSYREVDGKMLPEKITVRYGESEYGTFTLKSLTSK